MDKNSLKNNASRTGFPQIMMTQVGAWVPLTKTRATGQKTTRLGGQGNVGGVSFAFRHLKFKGNNYWVNKQECPASVK